MLIKLKKEYFEEFDDVKLATYLTILSTCVKPTNNYISINSIVYLLYGDLKMHQQIRRKHTNALSLLIAEEYIPAKKIDKSSYAVDMPDSTSWEYYATVTPEELEPIFSSNNKNKLSMMQVLIAVLLCRSRRTRYKVCDVSVKLLCDMTNKAPSTVQRALDDLVELGVLHKAKICDHRANVFGLSADKEAIDRYAQTNSKRINKKKQPQTEEVAPEPEVKSQKVTYDDIFEIYGFMDATNVWNSFIRKEHFPTLEEVRSDPEKYRPTRRN